jgi:hypothetical protein
MSSTLEFEKQFYGGKGRVKYEKRGGEAWCSEGESMRTYEVMRGNYGERECKLLV